MPRLASSEKTKQLKRARALKTKPHALLACPTNGAGWCAYPFTVAQLEKRLKAKAAKSKLIASEAEK